MTRKLEIDDLLRIEYLSDPVFTRDCGAVFYVVNVAEPESGEILPHIWRADADGTHAVPALPPEAGHQKQPRMAADGSLCYLSDEGNPGIYQLWQLREQKRHRLTQLRHGVSWYSISPDGKKAALEVPLWPEDLSDGTDVLHDELAGARRQKWDQARKRAPIVVEEVMYKFDETHGVPDGSVVTEAVLDLASGSLKLLAAGTVPHMHPQISPDGSKVASLAFPHGGWSKKSAEVSLVDIGSGDERMLTDGAGALEDVGVTWMSSDKLCYGCYRSFDDYFCGAIRSVGTDAGVDSSDPQDLIPEGSDCFGPGAMAVGHTAFGDSGEQITVDPKDSTALLLLSAHRSVSGVWSLDARGEARQLTPDCCCIHSFAARNDMLAYVKGEPDHIADLYVLNRSTGHETRIAHHNAWLDDMNCPVPQETWVASPDGTSQIHGWVLLPERAQEAPLPAVLDIHGGPECFYPYDWWFEFQYLAARGMAVLWCDPHGSTTWGVEYQKGAWDYIAYKDLMAFLDRQIELGRVDEKRCGVTGGSYGGYMTNAIIGRTSRFAAAVSQRNLCNRVTSYGTGDMGSILEEPFGGVKQSLLSRLNSQSTTLKSIDSVQTPTCILHGTEDYRCGFEQADQLYHALRDRHPVLPARLVAFPGENHGITRTGNAYAQCGHLLEMSRWFERFLLGKTDAEDSHDGKEQL